MQRYYIDNGYSDVLQHESHHLKLYQTFCSLTSQKRRSVGAAVRDVSYITEEFDSICSRVRPKQTHKAFWCLQSETGASAQFVLYFREIRF